MQINGNRVILTSQQWPLVKDIPSLNKVRRGVYQIWLADYFNAFSHIPTEHLPLKGKLLKEWQAISNLKKLKDVPFQCRYGGLYAHQKVGALYLTSKHNCILADDMGLGKTYSALAAIDSLFSRGKAESALIVTPASVKWQWKIDAIDKYFPELAFRTEVVDGSKKQRISRYHQGDIVVVNYELLRNDLGEIKRNFDIVCVDEVHYLKNCSTKRSKAVRYIARSAKYKWGLSGTPIQNRVAELWHVFQFIDPTPVGGYAHFTHRYIQTDWFGGVTGYRHQEELKQRLSVYILRRTKDEVLDLPEKIREIMYVDLTSQQKQQYRLIKLELAAALEGSRINHLDALTKLVYLRQLCDSPLLLNINEEGGKIPCLMELLDQLQGRKIVIYSEFHRMTSLLYEKLKPKAVHLHGGVKQKDRLELIHKFQEPGTDYFLTTAAGGEGINLQCADTIIFMDIPWNPAKLRQLEDRLHRIGQSKSVLCLYLVVQGTVEEKVLRAILSKDEEVCSFLNDDRLDFKGLSTML